MMTKGNVGYKGRSSIDFKLLKINNWSRF